MWASVFKVSVHPGVASSIVPWRLFHELPGIAPECGDGMNVSRDVEHGNSSL